MRVVVVGAGIAGLAAARHLVAGGVDVTVIDKGKSVGGRMATRRIGAATVDHGAQFFTVRTTSFEQQVVDWSTRGLVHEWNRGFVEDGHPRFVASRGMNSLAKDLADGLTVETSTMAFTVRPNENARASPWSVVIDDGTIRQADAVILTCPLPQSFSLLVDAGIELDERVFRTEYDRTIALLAVVDRETSVAPNGGIQQPDDVFSFIGDNQHKGVSATPAITFHATPTWSEAHWDNDPEDTLDELERAAARWLNGAVIVERQLKKWRFATPRTIWPEPYWSSIDGTIVVAGDAFAGPKIEGAYNSGLAAADHVGK